MKSSGVAPTVTGEECLYWEGGGGVQALLSRSEIMPFLMDTNASPCCHTIERGFQHGITSLKNKKNVPKCEFQQMPLDKFNAADHQGQGNGPGGWDQRRLNTLTWLMLHIAAYIQEKSPEPCTEGGDMGL